MSPEPPAIYCVNLKGTVDRRERMKRRFAHHGLTQRAQFVAAVEYTEPRNDSDEWKAMAGRYDAASHLECMRRILTEVPEAEGGAVICEDDVLIRDGFGERVNDALANLPEDANMLLLGFMLRDSPRVLNWAGRDPGRHNMVRIIRQVTWGAHAYWISHAFARELVRELGDLPISRLGNVVEDLTTFASNGYAMYPPVMIQEALDSVIRPASEVNAHVEMQRHWPYRDYAAAEEDPPASPLAALPEPPGELPSDPPGPLLEELIETRFAMNRGSLELEGVELGTVDLGDGRTLRLEEGGSAGHRLVATSAGGACEASAAFRLTTLPSERSRGIAVADGKLVIGFEAAGGEAGLAACDLDAALALLRPVAESP